MRESFLGREPYHYTDVALGQPLPPATNNRLRLVRTSALGPRAGVRRVAVDIQWYRLGNNKHKYLSITGTVSDHTCRFVETCGAVHDDIAKAYPELVHLLKWHMCTLEGPLYYLENTLYHASDDGAGEIRYAPVAPGSKIMAPMWERDRPSGGHVGIKVSATRPPDEVLSWRPVLREGKPRNFELARESAVWPDATDEQLSLPREQLTALLFERLPGLLQQFRADMTALGFNLEE